MICKNCGKRFPKKIWKIHEPLCQPVEKAEEPTITMDCPYMNLTEEELRALAKKRGIRSWHNKKIETIEEELLKQDADSSDQEV